MEGFTAEQASRFTSCTPHQLRYWDRIGLVKPSVQETGGRPGVRRLYSFRDLISLKVIRSLLDGGMKLMWNRLFREETGVPPHEYLVRRRLRLGHERCNCATRSSSRS